MGVADQVQVVVIGAGIVGLATALQLARRFPHASIVVLDKENTIGSHQTTHNSGVLHSGIYYKPGSHKAKLCIDGKAALVRFCANYGVPYEICGKVIVATSERELPQLELLSVRGAQNGLSGLRSLSAAEIREYEPFASGLKGIYVPTTGIVNYATVAAKYAELIEARGGTVRLAHEVLALRRLSNRTVVETTKGHIEAKFVINCAGLQSDRIREMAEGRSTVRIVPFRGEYYEITAAKQSRLRGLLYPVPDPQFPFLGVHLTRRIGGGVEAGPNAVLALRREGYSKTAFSLTDVYEYATFPGFWAMAHKHWRGGLGEYHRSWSRQAFLMRLQMLMPDIQAEDLIPAPSGIRAQALDRNGRLLDDFCFAHSRGMVHVCNVPSPAATASLAIGNHIVETVLTQHGTNAVGLD